MILSVKIAETKDQVFTKTVFVNDYCTTCGAQRSEPTKETVNSWVNPCGHSNSWNSVFEEYTRRMNFFHRGRGDKYEPTFESFFKPTRTILHL